MSSQILVTDRSNSFNYLTRTESRLLAMTIISLLLRNILLKDFNYLFIVWNLFLAFVPIIIQQLSLKHVSVGSKLWYLTMASWLLFLPNAPYIVTDLIHPITSFQRGKVAGLPLGFLSVISAAGLGLMWYFRSLRFFEKQLDHLGFSDPLRRATIALVALATGCGVWMGRTLRLNTWDVLTKPWQVVTQSAQFITTPMYAEWIFVTALILWCCWRVYERWYWVSEVIE